jgi:2-amino-4-hydroxy-6-hydroxymethyldihydropteridine diphosphokinase
MRSTEGRSLIALGLGGNQGDVERLFVRVIGELEQILGRLLVAPLYRTAPVSPITQPPFFNTAVVATTEMQPPSLLALLKRLELLSGRRRGSRHGPRPLDLDLLLYGQRMTCDPELTLPHPRLRERRFVLAPLADIAPQLTVPPDGRRIATLLADLDGPGRDVERIAWSRRLAE